MATVTGNPQIVDDKSPICIPFIVTRLREHVARTPTKPFIIGLNGVQGVGKTRLVTTLAETLRKQEHLETVVVSIDDFYLTYESQVALAASQPDNALVQCRGEPAYHITGDRPDRAQNAGTHDMKLAQEFFSAVCAGLPTKIPQYDKSAYSGQGDRVPNSQWETINRHGTPKVQVVIFEGWSVGFRPLSQSEVEERYRAPSRTLKTHKLEHLEFVNDRLHSYDPITDLFNAFIHIDAENTEYVYEWRMQQERMLRREKGTGMTEEQVIKFVDAYYPAYELFADKLRSGLFADNVDCQLRLVVDKDRRVKQIILI
ncbi:D-glycerate 3-kinase [Xylariales sp. PMI_506]|nr:D-glycerate 3-kinase [Xylariales sp. PMI_506]